MNAFVAFFFGFLLAIFNLQVPLWLTKIVALLILIYMFFIDSARLKPKLLYKYYFFESTLAIFLTLMNACILYFISDKAVGGVSWSILAIAAIDFRMIPSMLAHPLIPLRVRELWNIYSSLSGIILMCLITAFEAPNALSVIQAIIIGLIFGLVMGKILSMLKFPPLIFFMPLCIYLLTERINSHSFLSTLVAGLVFGSRNRFSCIPIFLFSSKYHQWCLALVFFLLGGISSQVVSNTSWGTLGVAAAYILVFYPLLAFVTMLATSFRWETKVVTAFFSPKGIVSACFFLLIYAHYQFAVFEFWIYILSVFLFPIITPFIIRWYGGIFTGRDPFSKLEEHSASIELPK